MKRSPRAPATAKRPTGRKTARTPDDDIAAGRVSPEFHSWAEFTAHLMRRRRSSGDPS
jgi:hypothetical protein